MLFSASAHGLDANCWCKTRFASLEGQQQCIAQQKSTDKTIESSQLHSFLSAATVSCADSSFKVMVHCHPLVDAAVLIDAQRY